MFRFDHSYARLPQRFYESILPVPVRDPQLIFLNRPLLQKLETKLAGYTDQAMAAFFSGNEILPGSQAIALAYAGHQFGHFVPRLGDGRAVLLGEVLLSQGGRWDIQLKGSGPTSFSRNGDGRAPLGPMMREVLISESMHALGIPTTRALALVSTGESVEREHSLPGAVLTRVAQSHLRVGTFEYFYSQRDWDGLRALADYAIQRHFPEALQSLNPYLAFLNRVLSTQAQLVAKWMLVGFIHGVMNTDNTAISGETLDYGPCAFLDEYRSDAVFSFIDRNGRYAYGNQPAILRWNLTNLSHCLMPLIAPASSPSEHGSLISEWLSAFDRTFEFDWMAGMRRKLGVSDVQEGDASLAGEFLEILEDAQTDYTLAFRLLEGCLSEPQGSAQFLSLFASGAKVVPWLQKWHSRVLLQGRPLLEIGQTMLASNPAIIPRNHQVAEVIRIAEEIKDFGPFHDLLSALTSPFSPSKQALSDYGLPPRPEQRIEHTYCGT